MLPDLDANADTEIVTDNVRVVQAIYFARQLEDMRAFQVVDRLVELFQQGMLPLGSGRARKLLEHYGSVSDRLSEGERRNFYAIALGAPGGDAIDLQPNHEFPTLWLRLISRVAMFECEQGGSATGGQAMSARAAVERAARALAANASVHGAGLVVAVRRLSADANALRAVLEAPEIRRAYGARDMWQVIDQVATNELGRSVNVSRRRQLAHAGSTVLQWLADHADALNRPVTSWAESPFRDLINAVEQWLAASGTDDDAVADAGSSLRLHRIARELIRLVGLHALLEHDGRVAALEDSLLRRGLLALFCGAAGTGKTLGAHAVAAALSRDLVRVDLSRIVSKYVGETEKALEAVLRDAERTDTILLLDEADALFGRRSQVDDAYDHHATVERDALLRRLQAHEGVVILECSTLPAFAKGERWAGLSQVVCFPRPPVAR